MTVFWNGRERGKFDHLAHLCQVMYLERTPDISSTRAEGASGAPPVGMALVIGGQVVIGGSQCVESA
jgi:hypothetical protein